jgi:hypothetical protein
MTSGRQLAISRSSIGIAALVLLAAGLGLTFWPRSADANQSWPEACLKTGIVLSVVWLAYPQIARIPTWILFAALAAVAAVMFLVRKPSLLLLAVAVIFIVSRLLPQRPEKPPRAR